MLLELKNISAGYYRKSVLYDISLSVDQGEIVSLIGHNGAGKTTTLRTIFGLIKPEAGEISFGGRSILTQGPLRNVQDGICLIPQERFTFPDLTVRENLFLGAHHVRDQGLLENTLAEIYHLFPILQERLNQKAGTMSGGQQRMLSLSMALMAQPRFVMVDEPSLGLAPLVVQELMQVIKRMAEDGISILMVDQNVKHILRLSQRVYVMKNGHIVLEETGQKLLERDQWWDLF
jgi:branched-chain amino acid transport system ATP-binding protein